MYFIHNNKERVPIEHVMRGSRCCICRENIPNLHRDHLTAFKFPVKRPQVLEQWRKFAKLPPKGVDFTKFMMCSKHFREEDIKRQCFRTAPKLYAVPHIFPPETVLKFPGVNWNPNEETAEDSNGGEPASTIQSQDYREAKYDPDILLRNSMSSFYRPEHSSADENDETSVAKKFHADSPANSSPLSDIHDVPVSYEPPAVKTYPSKAVIERKQLLEKMKNELCRICGKKAQMLSPIFDEAEPTVGDELTLAKKLEMYLPLEINTEDDLPMSICANCHKLVLSWHELYVDCSAAECVLREVFGINKSVDVLKFEEQEKYYEEEEEEEEEEEREVTKYEEERVEETKFGIMETIYEELGAMCEEVETTCDEVETMCEEVETTCEEVETMCEEVEIRCDEETRCEEVEMRSEKEHDTEEDLFDDNISLDFKKQPRIKCYTTKRGVAEIREMSPEEDFETSGVNHGFYQSVKCPRRGVKSWIVRKQLSGCTGDGKSIVRRKRNIRDDLLKCTTVLMRPLTCSHCNAIFTEWEEYNRHKKKCRLEPTVCEECGAKISQRCYLKKHIKTHFLTSGKRQERPPPVLNCEWCDKLFKSRFALRCHRDSFHNGENGEKEPTNYCEPCCRVFVSNLSYKIHMKQHEDGSVKNCINLELIAADGDTLELSYNCPVCGMSFPDKMQVIIHMNTLNVKKCPKCRVKMSSERFTFTHKCKYWYCQYCNKQFYNKNRYQIHERVHTRERPYMCHICGKKFVSSESLFTHKKGHGKPAFKCEQCGKYFKKKVLYNMHMDSHAGKHYTCLYCGKNFIYPNNLTKHCKKAHRDELNST